jgi:type III secretion system low calcium response chaperone LcrH/SycD
MDPFVAALQPFEEILGVSSPKNLTPKERETLYAIAYGMYEEGRYGKAAGFFTKLVLHFPYEVRFWKGLAGSRQMEGDYKAALQAWSIVCLLGQHPPSAHFHAAECYLSLGEKEEALVALKAASVHLKGDAVMAEKIEQLSRRLEDG